METCARDSPSRRGTGLTMHGPVNGISTANAATPRIGSARTTATRDALTFCNRSVRRLVLAHRQMTFLGLPNARAAALRYALLVGSPRVTRRPGNHRSGRGLDESVPNAGREVRRLRLFPGREPPDKGIPSSPVAANQRSGAVACLPARRAYSSATGTSGVGCCGRETAQQGRLAKRRSTTTTLYV